MMTMRQVAGLLVLFSPHPTQNHPVIRRRGAPYCGRRPVRIPSPGSRLAMTQRDSDETSARLAALQRQDFLPHVGTGFTLRLEDGTLLPVELIEVRDLDVRSRPEDARPPFSLCFRSTVEISLPQKLYELEHPELRELTLFLVPIGPDETGSRYEAVFN